LFIALNLDVTSLLAQALLFVTGATIFIAAYKKYVSVFVSALRKSDGKSGCRLDNCHATESLILHCLC